MTVRTRFAPSPTGYMHIGGMRTALFNWLWARHNGGRFILRVDDTDRQRNVDEALQPILGAFRWLGLDVDEGPSVGGDFGPYIQSERGDFYAAAIRKLLHEGKAYRDFDPPELTQAERQAAEKQKRVFLNNRRSLELSADEIQAKVAAEEPHVVRLLVDRDRKVSIDDHIRGHVEWDCGLIADPVISRADGSPLYNLASVVDDAQMQITHVIRAEEHLTNTAVQALLFEALGHPSPAFAHIPFVAAPGTKEKLSKRDKKIEKYRKSPQFKKLFDIADEILPKIGTGTSETLNPVMAAYYSAVGFLPAALINGLARLGWSYDDKTENMSLDFIVENFTLDRIVKAPASLDPDKMLAYQEYWMGQLTTGEKLVYCLEFLIDAGYVTAQIQDETGAPVVPDDVLDLVTRLIDALGDRLKLAGDILRYDEFFVADEALNYERKAFEKRLAKPQDARGLLREFRDVLAAAESFDTDSLDVLLHDWVEHKGIGMGQIIHALRVATTGKPTGPGMFDCLALLGRDRCLARIDRALAMV